jgi:PAS domain S-box-containing protein
MNEHPQSAARPLQATDLRREAEQRLLDKNVATVESMAEVDVRALLHELQVHQIELEMQNEELQRAQFAAEEASEKYHDLFDFGPIGYFLWDHESRILEVNLAGAALLGLDRIAVVQKRLGQFVQTESRQAFADFCKLVLDSGVKQTCEVKLLGGGQPIYAMIEGIVAQDRQGQAKLCRAALIDITERKRLEVSLRNAHDTLERRVQERTAELAAKTVRLAQEVADRRQAQRELECYRDRYVDLYDSAPLGYFTLEEDGYIQETNLAGAAMLAADRDSLIGYPLLDYVVERDRSAFLRHIHDCSLGRQESTCEVTITTKDGRALAVQLHSVPLEGSEADAVFCKTAMTDISDRKRAEEALQLAHDQLERRVQQRTAELADANALLQQSHEQLQTIYEGMIEGLLITDIETKRFVRVNPSLCRMLGYCEEELLAASIEDIHPPEAVPDDLQRFQAAAEGRVSINEDRPVLRKDGSIFYADITGHRILYEGRPCLLALFRDITERKQAVEALYREHRTLKHMLQASDHERKLIAYDIHDGLAQYLTGAIMQLDASNQCRRDNPKQAAKAYDAGMLMVRQSLAEARRFINGVRPPILDDSGIVAAIEHLICEYGGRTGPKIDFDSKVEFGRLAVMLENAVYRIVQEGLTNAWKHSASKDVNVRLVQQGEYLRIEIQDWGVGFDPQAVREECFGLEGIRERARLLGGISVIESVPGQGTRIAVTFPIGLRMDNAG